MVFLRHSLRPAPVLALTPQTRSVVFRFLRPIPPTPTLLGSSGPLAGRKMKETVTRGAGPGGMAGAAPR